MKGLFLMVAAYPRQSSHRPPRWERAWALCLALMLASLGFGLLGAQPGHNQSISDRVPTLGRAPVSVGVEQASTVQPVSSLKLDKFLHPSRVSPDANFTVVLGYGPSVGSAPLQVRFSASVSGGSSPYLYTWIFGTGLKLSSQALANVSLNYTYAATFNGALWVNDSANLSVERTFRIIVEATPVTVTNVTPTPNGVDVNQNLSLAVTASGGDGTYTYDWNGLPPGCTSVNNSTLHCTPTSTGNYSVYVIVFDSLGLENSSAPDSVEVFGPLQILSFRALPSALDVGQSSTFTAIVGGGSSGLAWKWFGLPSGCPSINSRSLVCTPRSPGTFGITAEVMDSSGSLATTQALTLVIDSRLTASAPNASATGRDVGQQLTIRDGAAGGSGGYSFAWYGLPPGCPHSNSSVISCQLAGTGGVYNVSVNVTDSNHEMNSSPSRTLTLSIWPTISGLPKSVIVGSGAQFSVTTNVSGGLAPYLFAYNGTPPGCASTDSMTFACTPTHAGMYVLVVRVTDANGASVTASTNVTVRAGMGANSSGVLTDELAVAAVLALAVGGAIAYVVRRRRS